MAEGRNEYTGVTPPDLVGKKRFVCEVCMKKRSIMMLDWHHKTPQAAGGDDDPNNFARVETGCHTAIHRVAQRLISTKSKKVSASTLARDYAESITPDDVEGTMSRLLELAVLVASAMADKRSGKIAVGKSDIVIGGIPPRLKKLLLDLGKKIKGKSGRGIGVSGIGLMAVLGTLEKHHPEESDNIMKHLAERGICDFAQRPDPFPLKLRSRT